MSSEKKGRIPYGRRPFFMVLVAAFLFSTAPAAEAEVFTAPDAFNQGMLLKSQGFLNEAERMLKKALEFEPSNPSYHFELANVYALKYDKTKKKQKVTMLQAAARELEQTIMLQPDFIQAYFNLGVVYKKQGHYERAREQFRHVLEIQPSLVNAHMQIGATYEEQGFFDDAKDAYLKAKNHDFGNPGIESAIDDLKLRKQEDRDRMLAESAARFNELRYGHSFSPYSNAADYEQNRRHAVQSEYGLEQAIPYLSTWLISQFMDWRDRADEEEDE